MQGQFVRGIVDQLSYDSLGEVQVVEQKTRFQPSLPGICQKRTTALQMMIYRWWPTRWCIHVFWSTEKYMHLAHNLPAYHCWAETEYGLSSCLILFASIWHVWKVESFLLKSLRSIRCRYCWCFRFNSWPVLLYSNLHWHWGFFLIRLPISLSHPGAVRHKGGLWGQLECDKAAQLICRTLLEGLPNLLTGDPAKEFLKSRDVNAHKTLSQVISDHACIAGLPAKNLLELCAQLRSATQALPPLSNELLVNYIWQVHNSSWSQSRCNFNRNLWSMHISIFRKLASSSVCTT